MSRVDEGGFLNIRVHKDPESPQARTRIGRPRASGSPFGLPSSPPALADVQTDACLSFDGVRTRAYCPLPTHLTSVFFTLVPPSSSHSPPSCSVRACGSDSVGAGSLVGDTRWTGAYGVEADLVARTHCAVEYISSHHIQAIATPQLRPRSIDGPVTRLTRGPSRVGTLRH